LNHLNFFLWLNHEKIVFIFILILSINKLIQIVDVLIVCDVELALLLDRGVFDGKLLEKRRR